MATRASDKSSSKIKEERRTKLGLGDTPPIGVENARKARENIQVKLSVMQACIDLINGSVGDDCSSMKLKLDSLPKSQREFNSWNSESSKSESNNTTFSKNSNVTLLKHHDLLEKLRVFIDIIRNIGKDNSTNLKNEKLAKLYRRIAIEENLRSIAEKELTRSRIQLWRCQKEIQRVQAAHASAVTRAKDEISELSNQLQIAIADRAELAAALKKITGIKRASQ